MVVLVQQLPGFISILSSMHNTWPAVVSLKLPHLYRRDVAQPGRALAWGARGRQFKSARPDHLLLTLLRRNFGDKVSLFDDIRNRIKEVIL